MTRRRGGELGEDDEFVVAMVAAILDDVIASLATVANEPISQWCPFTLLTCFFIRISIFLIRLEYA